MMTDRPIIMTPENVRLLIQAAQQLGTGKRETRRLLYIASGEAMEAALLDGYPPHMHAPKGANWRLTRWHLCEPGDRLWVREACRGKRDKPWERIADYSVCSTVRRNERRSNTRASFHMPRTDSRLTLLVERVKIERLQDIDEADALAEGMTPPEGYDVHNATDAYRDLWSSLHGSPNSWDENPWVVAISFKPILGNIDALGEGIRYAAE